MLNTFIKPGLDDLSISRTTFDWGIPVRENKDHVMYVWLDALCNYITALGYNTPNHELFDKFWADENCEIVHVVGADITRFHTIYWPMFLQGLKLRLPDRVFVHGLLDLNGEKMSKSRGNVVSPIPLIERYGVDTVRWYLAKEMTFGSDGRFSPELFAERINMDLANNFGNLVNRTTAMINKYFEGKVPALTNPGEKEKVIQDLTRKTVKTYESLMDDLHPTEAFDSVIELLNAANKYIEESQPWVLAKEGRTEELGNVMAVLTNSIVTSAKLLSPALVETTPKVFALFGLSKEQEKYEHVYDFCIYEGNNVTRGEPLFPRLDVKVETEFISSISH